MLARNAPECLAASVLMGNLAALQDKMSFVRSPVVLSAKMSDYVLNVQTFPVRLQNLARSVMATVNILQEKDSDIKLSF